MTNHRFDLRTGIKDPVVLIISRSAVLKMDVESVIKPLRILMATRENTWMYKGQVSLVMDGWDEDPRAWSTSRNCANSFAHSVYRGPKPKPAEFVQRLTLCNRSITINTCSRSSLFLSSPPGTMD